MFFKLRALCRQVRVFHSAARRPSNDVTLSDSVSLIVAGNGAEGNPRSVFLTYNEVSFLFNCGSGTQRRMPELRLRASCTHHLFATCPNFENYSGLAALLLARHRRPITKFTVYGLNSAKIANECVSFDTKLRGKYFNFPNAEEAYKYKDLTVQGFTVNQSPTVKQAASLVYICRLKATKGALDLDKCFDARVPRNMVPVLEGGQPVTLDNGQVITPAMVHKPDQPERTVAILECTSLDNLLALKEDSAMQTMLSECEAVVHFSGSSLVKHAEYVSFLASSGSKYHMLVNEDNPAFDIPSVHRFQRQLTHLDSRLFPALSETVPVPDTESQNADNRRVIRCKSGCTLRLRPAEVDDEPALNNAGVSTTDLENIFQHKDGTERPGLTEAIGKLKQAQAKLPSVGRAFPEFVFLGTASSVGSPVRNVSSILVNLSPKDSILLDCGADTYGQLLRLYGAQRMPQVMERLRTIFVSHHHSDHHMGLVELIEKHHRFTGKPVNVLIPAYLGRWLRSMEDICLAGLSTKYTFKSTNILGKHPKAAAELREHFDSVRQISLVPVQHCAFAFAISVHTKDDFRFVYSGDTEPCDSLIKAAKGCDLLIHEATVEDELRSFAKDSFHTTFGQAVKVSKEAGAKFTILTHFSQRYGKLPFVPGKEDGHRIGLGFDFMTATPADFKRMPLLWDSLSCFYSKHLENIKYRRSIYERRTAFQNMPAGEN